MIIPLRSAHEPSVDKVLAPKMGLKFLLTLYSSPVYAGAPALSEDFTEGKLDLNEYLIKNPNKTFIVKVSGDSMRDASIHPGDLIIVDSSIRPENGQIVVAALNGELTVKRLCQNRGTLFLMPENSGYAGIEVKENMDFMIWGVVTNVIHKVR